MKKRAQFDLDTECKFLDLPDPSDRDGVHLRIHARGSGGSSSCELATATTGPIPRTPTVWRHCQIESNPTTNRFSEASSGKNQSETTSVASFGLIRITASPIRLKHSKNGSLRNSQKELKATANFRQSCFNSQRCESDATADALKDKRF